MANLFTQGVSSIGVIISSITASMVRNTLQSMRPLRNNCRIAHPRVQLPINAIMSADESLVYEAQPKNSVQTHQRC